MKHKHYDLIIAWANGAEIQMYKFGIWDDMQNPSWHPESQYRIKPEAKPDEVSFYRLWHNRASWSDENTANIKATFDGDTGVLKSAEVIK